VFKKTEDSEWSRFSRALSGHSKSSATEDTEVKEEVKEPIPAVREVAQPAASTPASTPAAPIRPSVTQTYVRSHTTAQNETADTETVIGTTSSFDGNLQCEANLRIKGSASGEISCGKSLVIEESARVNANIKAGNAIVAGQLEGSIVCDGRLEVLATGRVMGELTAGVLIIQEGAFFEGHLKMKERKIEEKPAAQESPVPRRVSVSSSEPVVN
jgi:cytoskeletal protein CcmA (bactofilin family)